MTEFTEILHQSFHGVSVSLPVVSIERDATGRRVEVVSSPMLSRSQAAFYLGVSENTLDGLAIKKRGPGRRKWHVADLDNYLTRMGKL